VIHKVIFRPSAENDLVRLYDYIAAQGGDSIAGQYIDRIEAACLSLSAFPQGGVPRDDIRRGLRTLAFERRALIVYDIRGRTVRILYILAGGRDLDRIFGG
jgi:toxin ParE1/3/4